MAAPARFPVDQKLTSAAAASSGEGCAALGLYTVGGGGVDGRVVGAVEGAGWLTGTAVVVVVGAPAWGDFEEHAARTEAAARRYNAARVGTEGQGRLSAVLAAVLPSGHPAAYDVLVGLHVVCAVIGFGAVAISGAYGAVGRHAAAPGARPHAADEVRRYFASGSAMEYLLLVAPVFGVAAMSVRPGGSEFGQVWAVGGTVIWIVAGGLLTAVVRPAERRIRAAGMDLAPLAGEARKLMWAAAGCDLLFVVALFLMVTQPR